MGLFRPVAGQLYMNLYMEFLKRIKLGVTAG
jgi:hypothetical protein